MRRFKILMQFYSLFPHEVNLFIESKLQKSKNFKTFKAGHKLGKRHEQGGLL